MDFCGKHFIYKMNPQADPGIPAAAGILLSDKSYKLSTEACPSSGYFSIPLLQSNVCTYYDHENIYSNIYAFKFSVDKLLVRNISDLLLFIEATLG